MTSEEIGPYELLDEFKELYPELNSAAKILSKYPMAQNGEESFVREYSGKLSGGARGARQIYRTAFNIQEKAALIWANVADNVSPYYNQSIFNNIPEDFLNHLQSLPEYDRLFGSLDYVSCDHCRSIFGPAAYFIDLLRFVDTYISKKNLINPITGSGIPEDCTLSYRRPDLYKVRLNCSNSNDLMPQIDLVNELLESFITREYDRDAYLAARDAIFPQWLPFNRPREEICSYLRQYGTSLHKIYDTLAGPFEAHQFDEKDPKLDGIINRNREILDLSPEDYSLITSEITTPEEISRFYGDIPLAGVDGLDNVDVLLEQTGLTRNELNELLFQGLDRWEVNSGLSRLFFINSADDGLEPLALSQDESYSYDRLLNLSPGKLDRLYRFLKLSRKLGWSLTDLDWSLRSLQEPYAPERILKFDGINDYVACHNAAKLDLPRLETFTIEAWIYPESSRRNILVGLLANRVGYRYHILLEVDPSDKLVFRIRSQSAEISDYADTFELVSNSTIPLGAFTHIALVAGNGYAQLYINGKIDNKKAMVTPFDGSSISSSIDMNIGRDLFDEHFDGCIKDLRFWEVARDPQAIEEDRYHRFTGREMGLIGYWPLVEDLWIDLQDLTEGGTPGVLGGEEFITQPKWVYRDLILDPLPFRGDGFLFELNGVDQYMAARGVGIASAEEFSIEAWVKIKAQQINCILCLGDDSIKPKIAMLVDDQGKLVLTMGPSAYQSSRSISTDKLTHVSIVLKKGPGNTSELDMYINGDLDSDHAIDSQVSLEIENGEMNVGRDFEGNYFNGGIKEIRIWSQARTSDQINLYMYRPVPSGNPGLAGYWRPDKTEGGLSRDLTCHGNDLHLGGLQADYEPTIPETADPIPDAFPVPASGTVLDFDGDNDVIAITNKKNWGLGRYERMTLGLWFNPAGSASPSRKQVIFTQGDTEAGLNIYLYNGKLYVLEWNNNLEGTVLSATAFYIDIEFNTWHYFALTHDEFPDRAADDGVLNVKDNVKLRAYLDGEPMIGHWTTANQTDPYGYRLSPVGTAYMGGLGKTGITRFQDEYSAPNSEHLYFFSGKMADLRIWSSARSIEDIKNGCHLVPPITDDLITYMPLYGWKNGVVYGMPDISQSTNPYRGAFQKREIALETSKYDPELIGIYSHYSDPAALNWTNYSYSGRIKITDPNSAAGVTFLSRHTAGVDQCYILGRDRDHPRFRIFAHTEGIQTLSGTVESDLAPVEDIWYRFLINVSCEGDKTKISAKVWPDGSPEPDKSLEAVDLSPDHITKGTVGLWSSGTCVGQRRFDNLRVKDASNNIYLDLNFEDQSQVPEPANWQDTDDRFKKVPDGGLFKQIQVANGNPGETAFGTDSSEVNIHSYYYPGQFSTDPLQWNNYVYQGRMRISNANAGIGVTFYSRQPEGKVEYYRLWRDADNGTFRLMAQPHGAQTFSDKIDSKIDSGVNPLADKWYRFLIKIWGDASSTRIQAKIWADGDAMPDGFQINAYDERAVRIKSGTVGLWASGSGSKYFDALSAMNPDDYLFESFEKYLASQDPTNWRDTKENYSNTDNDLLFKTFKDSGKTVFGTISSLSNIHSHYIGTGAKDWNNYLFTGRMKLANPLATSGLGVTFLSQFFRDQTLYKRYYSLVQSQGANSPFRIVSLDSSGNLTNLNTRVNSAVIPSQNTWYRFTVIVEDDGTKSNIRAKIWPESAAEPTDYQIEASDDNLPSSQRLKSGTIGLVTMGTGTKYFDDLEVRGILLVQGSVPVGSVPAGWKDVGSRVYELDNSLFNTVDLSDNILRLEDIDSYPVLLSPLSQRSLEFDGVQQYLAANIQGGIELSQFALEAWINLSKINDCPILTLSGSVNGAGVTAIFGTDQSGRLGLMGPNSSWALTGNALDPDEFIHVALSVNPSNPVGSRVKIFVNSNEVEKSENVAAGSFPLKITRADIGRFGAGQFFRGRIKEVRIWKRALDISEIREMMYQKPLGSADLAGYWSLGEDGGDTVPDLSNGGNPMRLGGAEIDRRPVLKDLDAPHVGFWRPDRKVLDFNGDQSVILTDGGPGVLRQRRTVELWFRAEDTSISGRMQVIYHEGDDKYGLLIYICEGSLYFGGYLNNSPWENGTWLHTDRIESGRWHHCALVLDGRAEVRDESFQGFLDGKKVDSGPGIQIPYQRDAFTLGGIRVATKFYDPVSGDIVPGIAPGHHFKGQLLRLRIWNSARSAEEIRSHLYEDPDASGSLRRVNPGVVRWEFDAAAETWVAATTERINKISIAQLTMDESLILWWEFDQVTDSAIKDLSSKGHTATVADGQKLLTIALPSAYVLPKLSLDQDALNGIAAIKRLKEAYDQPVDQLTALWYSINHVGNDGQTPLFDRVFNPEGAVIEPWSYYLDEPVRWDKTGSDGKRDGKIRSRLMGALRVSDGDLNAIVEYISGSDENIIDLDGSYLWRMYQISSLSHTLQLGVGDLVQLLSLFHRGSVDSLEDAIEVSDLAEWVNGTNLSVSDIAYLTQAPSDLEGISVSDVKTKAGDLLGQSQDILISSRSFISDNINEDQSDGVLKLLTQVKFGILSWISVGGGETAKYAAVTPAYTDDYSFEVYDAGGLLDTLASSGKWINEFNTLRDTFDQIDPKLYPNLGSEIIQRLQTEPHVFINASGLVLPKSEGYGTDSLMAIFDGKTIDSKIKDNLYLVTNVLVSRKALQDQIVSTDGPIHAALKKSRDGLRKAVISWLAGLFDKQEDLTSAIFGYLEKPDNGGLDASRFMEEMGAISAGSDLPADLTTYLSKVSKLVYMAGCFNLTGDEVGILLSYPDYFSISSIMEPTLQDLDNLHLFKVLQSAFGDTEGKLIDILAMEDKKSIEKALYDLSGWEVREVNALADHFNASRYNTIPGLNHLKQCFDLASSMQAGVDLLIQLGDTGSLKTDEYSFYSQQSSGLLEVLRAGYTDEEWPGVYEPVYGELAEKRRDALLGLALESLPKTWDEYLFSLSLIPIPDPIQAPYPITIPDASCEELRVFLGRKLRLDWVDGAVVKDGVIEYSPVFRWLDSRTIEAVAKDKWAKIYLGDENTTVTTDSGLAVDLTYEHEPRTLFSWDDVPGSDSADLVAFLKECFGLDTVTGPVKSDNEITLTARGTEDTDVSFTLGDFSGDVTLEIGGSPYKLESKVGEDGKRYVYLRNVYRQNRFRKGPDRYYEYFLLDMEVGHDVETSRIVQGTAAVQYYIQRCLMNLEPGVDPSTIPQEEWEWVKNYRVWEANRKVFLYPENYIEPELRDTKTPFFKDLEDELLQSDISQESVETAYVHYLEKFAEVAGLKIVGSYLHTDLESYDPSDPGSLRKTLYLVGKTSTEPGMFYLRRWVSDGAGKRWQPWEKIDLTINSDYVTPVYAFGKLFIFWVEFTNAKAGTASGATNDVFKPTVKYSYYNLSNEWMQPQSYAELNRDLGDAEHKQIRWQRLCAQRVLDLSSLKESAQTGTEENALVLKVSESTILEKEVPDFDMSSMTWEFWANFTNNRTDGWPAVTPPGGSSEADCYLRTCTLIDYGNSGFRVRAIHRVTEVEGWEAKTSASAIVFDKVMEAWVDLGLDPDHPQSADFISARTCYNDLLNPNNGYWNVNFENLAGIKEKVLTARDSINDWESAPAESKESAAATVKENAQAAYDAAKAAKDDELAMPKWVSNKAVLSFEAKDKTPVEFDIDYGTWHHIAVTLSFEVGKGYVSSLYLEGNKVEDASAGEIGGRTALAEGGQVIVGRQDANVRDIFSTQMSEFRLWDYSRSGVQIKAGMGQRLKGSRGLFCLPLNEVESGSSMILVSSELDFSLPLINILPKRILERERLLLFYGDQIASLRNNLKDRSFHPTLTNKNAVLIKDVSLSFDDTGKKAVLCLVDTKGLSIDDFSTGAKTGDGGRVDLSTEWSITSYIMKGLEGSECLLSDVVNQPGWFTLDTGDDQFLMKMIIKDMGNELRIPTTEEMMKVDYETSAKSSSSQEISVSFEVGKDNPLISPSPKEYAYDLVATTGEALNDNILALSLIQIEGHSDGNFLIASKEAGGVIFKVGLSNGGKLGSFSCYHHSLDPYVFGGNDVGWNIGSMNYEAKVIAVTPDGTKAVSAGTRNPYFIGQFNIVTFWDLGASQITERKSLAFSTYYESFQMLAISDNGDIAVTASEENWSYSKLMVWDINMADSHPQSPKVLEGSTGKVTALKVFSTGSKLMALSASDNGMLYLWDLSKDSSGNIKGDLIKSINCGVVIEALNVVPDGSKVVIAAAKSDNLDKHFIRVYSIDGNQQSTDDKAIHRGKIRAVCTFYDGSKTRILSGSDDMTLKVWDLDTLEEIRSIANNSCNPILAMDATADGGKAVTFSSYGYQSPFCVWNPIDPSDEGRKITFEFERLNTYAVQELSENLFVGGIDELLSIESQKTKELDFWNAYDINEDYVDRESNSIPNRIDFKGPQRLYFEEIFFHAPFLIANSLNTNQKFEEAQKWYHYLFNPTATEEGGIPGKDKDRYWRYLPFRDDSFQSLKALLTDEAALAAYREDPFDPHAIAALRMAAYKKAIVMKYIDNLLDWGDSLFMEDTRESINEALGHYILASDLLGPRPKSKTIKRFQDVGTYEDFAYYYDLDTSEFQSEFLTAAEKAVQDSAGGATPNPHMNFITDFCVPENGKFIGYWDLVEDRLYKIRHSMNFEGTYRQLDLFAPEIEPSDLVRSVARGGGVRGALADLKIAVPHYRYPFVVALAKEMTSNVISLGSSLLDAIEKRDAEQLASLQNTQERYILEQTTEIKNAEIEEANNEIAALTESKKRADDKKKRYETLINGGNLYQEDLEIAYLIISGALRGTQSIFKILKGYAETLPEAEAGAAGAASSPVATTKWGGKQLSAVFEATGDTLECLSECMDHEAEASGKTGEYIRRDEEWEFERDEADSESKEIAIQITSAESHLKSVQKELEIHLTSIEQNKEIAYFYKRKFSSEDLYTWMVGRLSSLYFQSYKTAYDLAKSAEKCLQYEIPSTSTYITQTHWDDLRKGLLAGESLMLQIDQMEKSHLAQDSRFLEIEKTISMKKTFPLEFTLLKIKGACEFQLREEIFDRDYPGHYFRVIKTVELTVIPSVELVSLNSDPDSPIYQSLNMTLIQLGNKTLLRPDKNAVGYLLGKSSEKPGSEILRVNWRANQQVAISKPKERDGGMFVLDFIFDNRYFPFEGTGALSSWRLEIPPANNPDLKVTSLGVTTLGIQDVLIHIRYTAKSDRGSFKSYVEGALPK